MRFDSYEFLLVFLPLTWLGYYAIGRFNHTVLLYWLVAASLVFYSWWNPPYVLLIMGSIGVNFLLGRSLVDLPAGGRKRAVLIASVAFNVGLLGYYKYTNFFLETADQLFGTGFDARQIFLPLAISFFTFQQIAFLRGCYSGDVQERSFLKYSLFVSFFPQLIAGPIVDHREVVHQFVPQTMRPKADNVAVGITMIAIGLFKKVVLADQLATYVDPVFLASDSGQTLSAAQAWFGAFGFTMHIYFDFSAYADIAVGLGALFGISLPFNFDSPLKQPNIIEFWHRFHMTLSRFLRDHVYAVLGGATSPLGLPVHGFFLNYTSLAATMLIGGLWHGASWTFAIWGLLNGLFLVINHFWRRFRSETLGHDLSRDTRLGRFLGHKLGFVSGASALVFFRSQTFAGATNMLSAMYGGIFPAGSPDLLKGDTAGGLMVFQRQIEQVLPLEGIDWTAAVVHLAVCAGLAFYAPNTREIMQRFFSGIVPSPIARTRTFSWAEWRPSRFFALLTLGTAVWAVIAMSEQSAEFVYFQF